MKPKFFEHINKRVYKSFLVSYMTIFSFLLIICIIMFSVTVVRSSKQYAETGLLSVTQLQNIMDTKLDELSLVGDSLFSQKLIGSAEYFSYPLSTIQIYNMREIKDLLRTEVTKSSIIKELYLRFESSDTLLSSQQIYHGKEMASVISSDFLMDYSDFLDCLVFDGMKKYYVSSNNNKKEFFLVRKFVMSKSGMPSKVSLILRVDMDSLSEMINGLSIDSEYNITIADDVNRVLLGGAKFDDAITITSKDPHSYVYINALISGKPITFVRSSAKTFLNYHFTIQMNNKQIVTAIIVLLTCFIASIIGGLILCVYLAKKQYVPVNNLLKELHVEEKDTVTDEYNAITAQIAKLRSSCENAEKFSEKYYSLYRKKILTDLILGDNVALIQKALLEDNKLLPLHSDAFILLCLFPTKLPDTPVKFAGTNHMEVLSGSITDMVKDYFQDSVAVYSVTINRSLYLLLNPSDNLTDDALAAMYKDLFEIISEIRKYILQLLNMSLSAAVSNLRHSTKHINDAYLETESVKEIISQNPNFSPILCYHELHRSENDVTFRSSRDEEIITYVNLNFADPDLCLATLAAKFGLSMPYISRIFKKTTGDALSDYIHTLRLHLAKDLLSENLTLNDISEKCGYANTLTLIRAFKKYEGMTPTEYKAKCLNRESVES